MSPNFSRSAVDRDWDGVVGLLLISSFLRARIVARFSHCDSRASPSPLSAVISGRSAGTLLDVSSFLRPKRWESRLEELGRSFVEETDLPDAADELRFLPLKSLFPFESPAPSVLGSPPKLGAEISSCPFVSLR